MSCTTVQEYAYWRRMLPSTGYHHAFSMVLCMCILRVFYLLLMDTFMCIFNKQVFLFNDKELGHWDHFLTESHLIALKKLCSLTEKWLNEEEILS